MFPRCLFEKQLPMDMITALACMACQQGIQPDEEVFRNFVAAGSYGDETAREMGGEGRRLLQERPGSQD